MRFFLLMLSDIFTYSNSRLKLLILLTRRHKSFTVLPSNRRTHYWSPFNLASRPKYLPCFTTCKSCNSFNTGSVRTAILFLMLRNSHWRVMKTDVYTWAWARMHTIHVDYINSARWVRKLNFLAASTLAFRFVKRPEPDEFFASALNNAYGGSCN